MFESVRVGWSEEKGNRARHSERCSGEETSPPPTHFLCPYSLGELRDVPCILVSTASGGEK